MILRSGRIISNDKTQNSDIVKNSEYFDFLYYHFQKMEQPFRRSRYVDWYLRRETHDDMRAKIAV